MANPRIEVEEFNLEDLIILGTDTKIPIIVEYPTEEGKIIRAKALIQQLTLKEMDSIKLQQNNLVELNVMLLQKALFTKEGLPFPREKILNMPIGVVKAIAQKIMELSGMSSETTQKLMDF